MINEKILSNIIKVDKVFLNTLTGAKFRIIEVDNDRVTCLTSTKLKRGHVATPVEFSLPYKLFATYLEETEKKEATFKVIEKI